MRGKFCVNSTVYLRFVINIRSKNFTDYLCSNAFIPKKITNSTLVNIIHVASLVFILVIFLFPGRGYSLSPSVPVTTAALTTISSLSTVQITDATGDNGLENNRKYTNHFKLDRIYVSVIWYRDCHTCRVSTNYSQ